jgi:carbamoyltransferase
MRTDMDYLAMGPFLVEKTAQREWKEATEWQQEFQLD